MADTIERCSFCGKTHAQVEKLIAGEGVFICNECIELCNDILEGERATARAGGKAGARFLQKMRGESPCRAGGMSVRRRRSGAGLWRSRPGRTQGSVVQSGGAGNAGRQ